MNLNISITALLQLLNDANRIVAIWNSGTSNDSIADRLKQLVPLSVPILEQIAALYFPKIAPQLHSVAGALVGNPNAVKYLQSALNILVSPSPNLAVDGIYGPRTLAAVHAFQKQNGFDTTGFLSETEDAVLAKLLTEKK
jgi:peptidoglycan hydrolase-like protein with peptidoglycan-binding domain